MLLRLQSARVVAQVSGHCSEAVAARASALLLDWEARRCTRTSYAIDVVTTELGEPSELFTPKGWPNDAPPLHTYVRDQMIKTISRDELKQKIDRKDNFVLVETLPKVAYEHAHLPGAINLPLSEVNVLAPKLLPDKNADIVVYCASLT